MQKTLGILTAAMLVSLTGCGDDGRDLTELASEDVDPNFGGFVTYDGEPGIVASFPPTAFDSETEVTLSRVDSTIIGGAVSPVILLRPEDTVLQADASLSISVTNPAPGLVMAQVTESGLVPLSTSSVDAQIGEVRADIGEFGEYVVVDRSLADLADDGLFEGGGSFIAAAGTPYDGEWQGTGPQAHFGLRLGGGQFEVTANAEVVRSGQVTFTGDQFEFLDAVGNVESGSMVLEGDELVMTTVQSGTIRWNRIGEPEPVVEEEAPKGFFAVEDKPEPEPEPESAPQQVASSPAPVAQSATAEEPPQKKGFFRNIGGGLKRMGGRVVSGVKNIGKSTAERTQASVENSVANAEAAAEYKVAETENRALNKVDETAAIVPDKMDEASGRALSKVGLDNPGAAGGGGNPCSLVDVAAVTRAIGSHQRQPITQTICRFSSAQGSVNVSVDWGDGRPKTYALDSMRRNNTCGPPHNVGDGSCVFNMSNGVRLSFLDGTAFATVEVSLGRGRDSTGPAADIARSMAARI